MNLNLVAVTHGFDLILLLDSVLWYLDNYGSALVDSDDHVVLCSSKQLQSWWVTPLQYTDVVSAIQ